MNSQQQIEVNGAMALLDSKHIEERIFAAIQPQLDRADRLIWELENPRTERGSRAADGLLTELLDVVLGRAQKLTRDDLTTFA